MSRHHTSAHGQWIEDHRYRVSNREGIVAGLYFLVYTVATIGTAWFLGGGKGVGDIQLIHGFPAWFFWSTLVLGAAFCVVPYFLVKAFFTDMSLEPDAGESVEGPPDGPTR